jgi:hypothetical protein
VKSEKRKVKKVESKKSEVKTQCLHLETAQSEESEE